MTDRNGYRLCHFDTAYIGDRAIAVIHIQRLKSHKIGILGIHLQHQSLTFGEIDFVLRTVSLKSTDLIGGYTLTHGVTFATLPILNPVNKDCAQAGGGICRSADHEVVVIQQNVPDLRKDRILLLAVSILDHIIRSDLAAAQRIVDTNTVQRILVTHILCCSIDSRCHQIHLVCAVGQSHKGHRGDLIVITGYCQVINDLGLLGGNTVTVVSHLCEEGEDQTGICVGTGIHIHTRSGEGKGRFCADLTVCAGNVGAAVGVALVICQVIRPAVDVAVRCFLLVLRLFLVAACAIRGFHEPVVLGEHEAVYLVYTVFRVGDKGILVVHVVGRDHRNLVPQIAVFVGILADHRIAPCIAKDIELIVAAPAHGHGSIGDLTVFQLHVAVTGIAVLAGFGVFLVGSAGIKPVHTVFHDKIQMLCLCLVFALIVKVPAGKGEFLTVVQHICPFHEDGGGLLKGQQQLSFSILLRQPHTGGFVVCRHRATPHYVIPCLDSGDLYHHLIAGSFFLSVNIPPSVIVAGDIHRMGTIVGTHGIGGILRSQVIYKDADTGFFIRCFGIAVLANGQGHQFLQYRFTLFIHNPIDLLGIAVVLTCLNGGRDHSTGGQLQALSHDIPHNGIIIQDDLLLYLGGDLLHDFGKIFDQLIR